MIVMSQRGSTSDLQLCLGMGYVKAGRVMDQLRPPEFCAPIVPQTLVSADGFAVEMAFTER